jgi:hypothetical protein
LPSRYSSRLASDTVTRSNWCMVSSSSLPLLSYRLIAESLYRAARRPKHKESRCAVTPFS